VAKSFGLPDFGSSQLTARVWMRRAKADFPAAPQRQVFPFLSLQVA
jgi:hypothetical protein